MDPFAWRRHCSDEVIFTLTRDFVNREKTHSRDNQINAPAATVLVHLLAHYNESGCP